MLQFYTHQFDIEDVLNFVAPYGILTNTSLANFKTALSGTSNLAESSKGSYFMSLCQILHVLDYTWMTFLIYLNIRAEINKNLTLVHLIS